MVLNGGVMDLKPAVIELMETAVEKLENKNPDQGVVPFDTAITMTGHGKFHHFLLFVNGIIFVAIVCELNSASYLLPAADCDFEMTSEDKGLLVSMVYIGYIASAHFWGYMADSAGRKKVLVISLALDFVCAIASSFSPTFQVFLVFRFFTGLFIGCPTSVVFAYIGEFHGPGTRARAIMLVSATIAVGSMVLPLLAWGTIPQPWSWELPTYTYNSWRFFVIVCSIPSLVSFFLLLFFLPESPKFLLGKGREEEAINVMKRMYAINSGKSADNYKIKSVVDEMSDGNNNDLDAKLAKSNWLMRFLKGMWYGTVPLFQMPLLPKMLLACTLQYGVFACFETMLLWLPEIFDRMSANKIAYPDSSPTVCEAMGAILPGDNVTEIFRRNDPYYMYNVNSTGSLSWISFSNRAGGGGDECSTVVSEDAFLYTLYVGASIFASGVIVGFIVTYISEKIVNILFLLGAGAVGLAMNFVTNSDGILALACFFVSFTQNSSGLVNSVTVENFPTHLRGMAICLSLMFGQVGVISGSLMIGAVIDNSCLAIFFVLSGIAILGGILSFLLPGSLFHRNTKDVGTSRDHLTS